MTKTKVMNWLQKNTMIIILVLMVLFFTWQTGGKILLPQNITNLIAQNAYVFILATGMLLCILTGGNIDLSVGSVVCFTGAVGALLMASGMNMWLAVVIMLAIGLVIGGIQAFCIAYLKVPPFITTLAGQLIFRGLSNVILNGRTQTVNVQAFKDIFGGGATCYVPDLLGGNGLNLLCLVVGILGCAAYLFLTFRNRSIRVKKGYAADSMVTVGVRSAVIVAVVMYVSLKLAQYKGIPSALIWVVLVVAVYGYVASKTTMGRYLYAVGGNEKATKLSGIDTRKVYFFAYTNMGFLAALAGIMTIARMASAQPTYGDSYEMDAISSCFIGGASAYGGVGTVPGVIIGAVLMGVINLGMSVMGIDQNYQKVVKGLVLLAAVIFDVISKRNDSK
ncbi:MAG: multiple monosaccharide ABC transporter permease [Oscillospiraceae bacterium]|nr:multiple monosaccharide ABC transporter permease [Oscillospiraceae bacterium]